MSVENEIRQLFEELKAVDQEGAPDFETTYRAAVNRKNDRLWYLRRAAAVALIVAVSFVMMWFVPNRGNSPHEAISISSWASPVDQTPLYPDLSGQSIGNWQSPTQFSVYQGQGSSEVSNWKSPTDFLLNTTKAIEIN